MPLLWSCRKIARNGFNFSWPGAPASIAPTLGAVAKAAEDAGITDLSVMDHYFQTEMRQYAAHGIDAVILMPGADDPVAEVRGLAPVVKGLRIHPFSVEARIPQ
ncbi:MAG: hypothetical protein HY713_06395 [candidate division NC10 bacterium]|nr:hypothetical protein [candidate division NC10 bacterium]